MRHQRLHCNPASSIMGHARPARRHPPTPGETMTTPTSTDQPLELFYSYAHADEALRKRLETFLVMLRREGVIREWHDRKIGAGSEWRGQIDAHLDSADVILLLVSQSFLASDYCYDVELRRAMERHEAGEARVIPIILRSCDWKGAPFAELQAVPRDGRPVMRWQDRDEAFLDVTNGIRAAVRELQQTRARARPH